MISYYRSNNVSVLKKQSQIKGFKMGDIQSDGSHHFDLTNKQEISLYHKSNHPNEVKIGDELKE